MQKSIIQILDIIIIISTLILISCNSTEPGNGSDIQETTHNIYWEADTLGDRFTYVYDVWGTDENNIWVAGWFTIDDWGTNFMHYNGTEWEQDPFFCSTYSWNFWL